MSQFKTALILALMSTGFMAQNSSAEVITVLCDFNQTAPDLQSLGVAKVYIDTINAPDEIALTYRKDGNLFGFLGDCDHRGGAWIQGTYYCKTENYPDNPDISCVREPFHLDSDPKQIGFKLDCKLPRFEASVTRTVNLVDGTGFVSITEKHLFLGISVHWEYALEHCHKEKQ